MQDLALQLQKPGFPGPHSHIFLTGGGGGGPRDFVGSEILDKRDIFGSIKDVGIFWVAKKTQGFFWV